MDSESALALGRALASIFSNGVGRGRIVIGKDTRLSGYMLETALASGICSMGADVLLVGPLPTPGIAFIAKSMRATAGAVISASHNCFDDNGIKFFDNSGFKLQDDVELRIEEIVLGAVKTKPRPTGTEVGRAERVDDATGRYIQFLKGAFPQGMNLGGMRVAVDCANGAGYKAAPTILTELGAEVIELGTHPDGTNINRDCGSLHPQRMCELAKKMGADAGLALDGDADRVIMCDEKGSVIDGDVTLALSAIDMKRQGRLSKGTLVATIMSNLALDDAMKARGISVVRTRVGDRYVIAAMRECGYNLGGEQSGHMIFMDHNTTGDGIMGGLKVLSIMRRSEKPLSELARVFEPYPQVHVNVQVAKKKEFHTIPKLHTVVEGFKHELGERGRLVLRYSGTENIARVMVEGEDGTRIRAMADEIAALLSGTSLIGGLNTRG